MRINKFVAASSGLSRRAADRAITDGRVKINGRPASIGITVGQADVVTLDGQSINQSTISSIMLNKPAGYVCSRRGQGSRTIYELLPAGFQDLKTAGRLDKDSSGLLILTNDGDLAQSLTHPGHQKLKLYEIELNHSLTPLHHQMISGSGIELTDGSSRLRLSAPDETRRRWQVSMHEGRNRQIRRTFAALGYKVQKLHRVKLGPYSLDDLGSGQIKLL